MAVLGMVQARTGSPSVGAAARTAFVVRHRRAVRLHSCVVAQRLFHLWVLVLRELSSSEPPRQYCR
ncbi:MAG: hypothetical protein ACXVXQ_01480, partial [Mycobacteriaceae bacterium]